jgi:hypothetical protein
MFDHSGHRPQFEEPDVFAAPMARVLDETLPEASASHD